MAMHMAAVIMGCLFMLGVFLSRMEGTGRRKWNRKAESWPGDGREVRYEIGNMHLIEYQVENMQDGKF